MRGVEALLGKPRLAIMGRPLPLLGVELLAGVVSFVVLWLTLPIGSRDYAIAGAAVAAGIAGGITGAALDRGPRG